MTRRILFCTIGQTPQVVTETVWALVHRREPAWVPDEIHIVTTSVGLAGVRENLQKPGGRLAPLFSGRAPPVTIHVPRRDGGADVYGPPRGDGDWSEPAAGGGSGRSAPGNTLADVNSQADAALMGDLILRLMAGFVHDGGTQVHVSLAGGRKTMSAHALLALTLVGRPVDEASHVLVSPSEFEDHREFWHPDQGGLIHRRDELRLTPMPPPSLDPRQADVILVPTPTPLMRYQLEAEDWADLERLRLADVVNDLNLAARLKQDPSVRLDTASHTISACGVERRLGAKHFAVYRLLATARKENWPGVRLGGEGGERGGWLSVPWMCVGLTPARRRIDELLLDFIRQAVAAEGGDPQDHKSVQEWETVAIETDPGRKLAFAEAAIASNTRLIETLKKEFGAPAGAILAPVVEKRRRWKDDRLNPDGSIRVEGATRFGLELPAEAIEIV